jgi:hypothetical protein
MKRNIFFQELNLASLARSYSLESSVRFSVHHEHEACRHIIHMTVDFLYNFFVSYTCSNVDDANP